MMWNMRGIEERIVQICSAGAALFAAGMLLIIVAVIGIYALPSLTPYFILTPESQTPKIGMGIANAIVGSIVIASLATLLATPLAIGTAIYLQRYAKDSIITRAARFFIEVLSGTPSVVVGIFGLLVLVYYLKPFTGGFSLIAGAIALAILIVPVIERSIEEAIITVPKEIEEGSYALGADKWQTIRDITVPIALPGLITGIIFGFGRAAEESAVVILTAGYSQFMPEVAIKSNEKLFGGIKIYPLQDVIGTLPYSVYHAYENSNVVKLSNGFAAAFVLICIVLLINLSAKIILSRTFSGNVGKGPSNGRGISAFFTGIFDRFRKPPASVLEPGPDRKVPGITGIKKTILAQISGKINPANLFQKKTRTPLANDLDFSRLALDNKKSIPKKIPVRPFLRAFLPFLIAPASLLLLAFLAGIPPFHYLIGPVSPELARLASTGEVMIVTVGGAAISLFIAKRIGAFRGTSRKAGYTGVAAGFCVVCISALVLSSAGAGFFMTGEDASSSVSSPVSGTTDKQAAYAAMLASLAEADTVSDPGESVAAPDPAPAQVQPAVTQTASVISSSEVPVVIPLKDSLNLGEVYRYGDIHRTVQASVYDYLVLPYYFWWFIDYNRFVQAMPAPGNSYLVVYMNMENIGDKSTIIPNADQITISYAGKSYERLPYLNTSVLSSWQISQMGTEDKRDQYYQWIREIGQSKRDYAYLTGENLFGEDLLITNSTSSSLNTTNSSSGDGTYWWYYLKPGQSLAVDGYLIFEVPDSVILNPEKTYVNIAFNNMSQTRWKLVHSQSIQS